MNVGEWGQDVLGWKDCVTTFRTHVRCSHDPIGNLATTNTNSCSKQRIIVSAFNYPPDNTHTNKSLHIMMESLDHK